MRMNGIVAGLVLLLPLAVAWPAHASEPFTFVCRADNDLFVLLAGAGEHHARFDAPDEAVRRAKPGSVLLVLADGYPRTTTPVDARFYDAAKAKRLRLYVEHPSMVP